MHRWSFNAYRSGFFRLLLIITLISFHSVSRQMSLAFCLVSLRVLWPAMLLGLLFMRTIILLALAAMDNKMETFWLTPPFRSSHIAAMLYWHKDNKTVWWSILSGRFISSSNYVLLSQSGAHHAALIAEIILNIRNRNSILFFCPFIHLLKPA